MISAMLLLLLTSTPTSPPGAAGEPLSPDALGAPPQVNAAPTAWACTVETLREGRECVFEAEVAASTAVQEQAAGNVRTLRDIARVLCTHAARPSSRPGADKNLVGQCEHKYTEAVEDTCGLDGKVPVIDARGRFAPEARACYRKLSSVLQDITMMAAVASECGGGTCASSASSPPRAQRTARTQESL